MPQIPKHDENLEGWAQYAHALLTRMEELHKDNKEIRNSIDEIKLAITRLEINGRDTKNLTKWKEDVTEVWSVTQMKEVKDEVYDQKTKWMVGYGVFIAAQIIWAIILGFKDKF